VVRESWKVTRASAAALAATRVLLQCPARFRPTAENLGRMRGLLGTLDRGGLTLMWEPRGAWPAAQVAELCRDLDLVHVVDPFVGETVTPETVYYRLHGIGGSRHSYSEAELSKVAARLPQGGQPYVLFNNLPRVGDAERFVRMVRPC
jgi:uncharacterized protein YecE (DUF72 family)